MPAFVQLARIESRIILRSKVAVFWTFAFPLILMIAEAKLGGTHASGGADVPRIISGVVAIVIVSTGLMGFAAPLIQAREAGILASCAAWPTSKLEVIAAMATARLQIIFLAVGLIILTANLVLHVTLPGNTLSFIGIILLGSATMLTFGAAVGARVAQTQTAIALCNLLYFGMVFLGEVFFKTTDLSPPIAGIMAWLPVNALVHGLIAAMQGNLNGLIQPCFALIGFLVASAIVVDRTFTWSIQRRVEAAV